MTYLINYADGEGSHLVRRGVDLRTLMQLLKISDDLLIEAPPSTLTVPVARGTMLTLAQIAAQVLGATSVTFRILHPSDLTRELLTEPEKWDPNLFRRIDDVDRFTIRILNAINRHSRPELGLHVTVNGDQVRATHIAHLVLARESDLLKLSNFGRKSLNHAHEVLGEMGLRLGISSKTLEGFPWDQLG